MGIAMLLGTTILNMILLFTIPLELGNIFIMVIVAALGYGVSNLYLDSYLYRHEIHYYDRGYEHGLDHGKEMQQRKDEYDRIF